MDTNDLSEEEEAQLDIDERVTAAKGDLMQQARALALGLEASSRWARIRERIRRRFTRERKVPKAPNPTQPKK